MASQRSSLALWMSITIAVFVLVGSLGLWLVFEHEAQREERMAFEALAKSNVAFLDRTTLPQSAQMAAQLGEVTGAQVFFWHAGASALIGKDGQRDDAALRMLTPSGKVQELPHGEWVIVHPLRNGSRVFFAKPAHDASATLQRPGMWMALGSFWMLSVALGGWLARRVARPLRALATVLPEVGTDRSLTFDAIKRGDEIGALARALQKTHESLKDEREKRRMAERLALIGRMAASLAHEVRNPVAAIQLHAQLLEGASEADAAVSRSLIESEAARIESLVKQWLMFSKPAPPVMMEVNLTQVVRDAVKLMQPRADHAAVKLIDEIQREIVIAGDADRLKQVLLNVLLNGIQAMAKGGRVFIRDEAGEANDVTIVVEDEGAGFSAEALGHEAEPFFSEKEGGMGLGLPVVFEICRAHGGRVVFENRTEGGARVKIILPVLFSKTSVPSSS